MTKKYIKSNHEFRENFRLIRQPGGSSPDCKTGFQPESESNFDIFYITYLILI